ncbi:hypothetical protein HUJ05_005377 [Dendroctonus ponderosae]|nr:hypothetical protein HUJ05_005377 [Dendroctonus ponderosae]
MGAVRSRHQVGQESQSSQYQQRSRFPRTVRAGTSAEQVKTALFSGLLCELKAMETWLEDVKRVRIPRPKFGSSGRFYVYPPTEPPKDYFYEDTQDLKMRTSIHQASSNLAKATEELRRAFREKL